MAPLEVEAEESQRLTNGMAPFFIEVSSSRGSSNRRYGFALLIGCVALVSFCAGGSTTTILQNWMRETNSVREEPEMGEDNGIAAAPQIYKPKPKQYFNFSYNVAPLAKDYSIELFLHEAFSDESLAISRDGSTTAYRHNSGEVRVAHQDPTFYARYRDEFMFDPKDVTMDTLESATAINSRGTIFAVSHYDASKRGGAVRVYQLVGGGNRKNWVRMGQTLNSTNSHHYDEFGTKLALSGNGTTLVVGAPGDPYGVATNKSKDDYRLPTGRVYVYEYNNTTSQWVSLGQKLGGVPSISDSHSFGASVALSEDGLILAIGSPSTNRLQASAIALKYSPSEEVWKSLGSPINGTDKDGGSFGRSVALSADGLILAVGAAGYSPQGCKIDDLSSCSVGAVHVFQYDHSTSDWQLMEGMPMYGDNGEDELGNPIALSSDGTILAAAARQKHLGIPARVPGKGYIRIFRAKNSTWQIGSKDIVGDSYNGQFGEVMALSGDGSILLGGAVGRTSMDEHVEHEAYTQLFNMTFP